MKGALDAAAFGGQPIDSRSAEKMIDQGEELIEQARHLARGKGDHDRDDRHGRD